MQYSLYTAMALLFLGLNAGAQEQNWSGGTLMDVNFALGVPVDEFAQETNANGYGVDAGIYFPILKQYPWLRLGPQFTYMGTGSDRIHVDAAIEVTDNGQVIEEWFFPMRIVTRNSMTGYHLALRANPPIQGKIRPYLHGAVGTRRLATKVQVYDRELYREVNSNEEALIAKSKPRVDWVFSYGAGGGVMLELTSFLSVNLGVQILLSSEATYYTKHDIENFDYRFVEELQDWDIDDPKLRGNDIITNTAPRVSRVPMVQGNLGLTFLIHGIEDLDFEQPEYP